jgi:hypothetical protein
MAFTVQFANGDSSTYPDQVEYEFLPNGVLALTNGENNVAYYSPDYWQGVQTENGHKPSRQGYPTGSMTRRG